MMNNNNYYNRKEPGSTSCKCPELKPARNRNAVVNMNHNYALDQSDMHRVTSLTAHEEYALTSLLIDSRDANANADADSSHDNNSRQLTTDILLTTPFPGQNGHKDNKHKHNHGHKEIKSDSLEGHSTTSSRGSSKKRDGAPQERRRNSKHHAGLWRAHKFGILPKVLRKGSSLFRKGVVVPPSPTQRYFGPTPTTTFTSTSTTPIDYAKQQSNVSMVSSNSTGTGTGTGTGNSAFDSSAAKTDMSQREVRPDRDDGSVSSASSWDDAPTEHFDVWQVMNDEYAEEFGFNYKPDVEILDEDEEDRQTFQIIGTDCFDLTAQPHVLSPPLMESLTNFVPESLSAENWWLKYSLVRDGASLETMQNYAKASQYTILAIQTTKGDVFGSFNTAPWHVARGYFGSGESFVWKMRNNRFQPCSSLYEQAHMESVVDVYPNSGLNSSYQFCTGDFLGVGSGEIEDIETNKLRNEFSEQIFTNEQRLELGFAFALHDDLQQGTSSPSGTYCNPKLTSSHDGVFEVSNLEVWTFTPCTNVDDSQQLEMKKHYLYERMMHSSTLSYASVGSSESLTSPVSSQRKFYRRLGEDVDNEFQTDRWIMANMKK